MFESQQQKGRGVGDLEKLSEADLLFHIKRELNLFSAPDPAPSRWERYMRAGGFANRADVAVSIATKLSELARRAESVSRDTNKTSETIVKHHLDMVLIGQPDAERVDPQTTPYGGLAVAWEVAHRDRAVILRDVLKIRNSILDVWRTIDPSGASE